jgi:hypothetical protein
MRGEGNAAISRPWQLFRFAVDIPACDAGLAKYAAITHKADNERFNQRRGIRAGWNRIEPQGIPIRRSMIHPQGREEAGGDGAWGGSSDSGDQGRGSGRSFAERGGADFPGRDRERDPLGEGVRGDAPRGGFAHRRGPSPWAQAESIEYLTEAVRGRQSPTLNGSF